MGQIKFIKLVTAVWIAKLIVKHALEKEYFSVLLATLPNNLYFFNTLCGIHYLAKTIVIHGNISPKIIPISFIKTHLLSLKKLAAIHHAKLVITITF